MAATLAPPAARAAERRRADAVDDDPTLKNVWSRSGSKHRIRAIVLLAVNTLLFAGVGSFAFWMRSGVRFAPAHEGYWDELVQTFLSVPFAKGSGVSLGSFLLGPISIQDVPMQIPILGLLMAALIAVPILVAILYRFWTSLPFIAVVGFLAVMPWLAITLAGSCIVASVRPFRTRFRFTSALLGLLPVAVYLVLAWAGTAEAVGGRIDPVDRIKFVAPWVLAIVASTILFAVVLLIARVVDYRPGAITPLLAVMFGLPVLLFEFHVGRDELYYRLLASLAQTHFKDEDVAGNLETAAVEKWLSRPPPRGSLQAVREATETQWLFELTSDLQPAQTALARHRTEVVERCDWFLTYFPHSRYALNALFLKARAMDMRIDPVEFRRSKWIRFYDDFPRDATYDIWRTILANEQNGLIAAVASLRLAQLEARHGKVERAAGRLSAMLHDLQHESHDADPGESTIAGALIGVWRRRAPEASLEIRQDRIELEAQRLHDLLTNNRDPIYGYEPLCGPPRTAASFSFGLLDLDPHDDDYVGNLLILKQEYPRCELLDNLDLELAKAAPSLTDRIAKLQQCAQRRPDDDAMPEVLFRLGTAFRQLDDLDQSDVVLQTLLERYPDSVWAKLASRSALHAGTVRRGRSEPGIGTESRS